MTLRQRIRFYQQLAVLVRAGLPIRASLVRLKERMAVRELTILSDKVNAGERLGDAFAAARFSPFEFNLITAGERSAQLDTVFDHLAEFWSREWEMRQGVVRPLYYPFAVLHLAILVWGLVEISTTAWQLIIVHFVMRMAALYVLIFVVYTVARISWSSDKMRRFWLSLPIIGSALKSAYAYRWITALRLEFGAGISLSRAVGDAWRASGYLGCERLAEEGEQAMRSGTELSKLVVKWKQLPRDWIDFIETGEISGAYETAFKNLEAEAGRTWKLAQERMASWVPKIVYFFVLLIVAAVVINLMRTIYVDPLVNAENQIDNPGK